MAATSGMLTSITLSSQSSAFKCKSGVGNALIIMSSVVSFIGFNMIHNPKLAKYADGINQALICLPPTLHTLTDMYSCPARSASDYSQAFNWISIFLAFAVPLVVYRITATDKFRTMICNFYAKKSFGVYNKPVQGPMMPADLMSGVDNAAPTDLRTGGNVDLEAARKRAMDVLHRAMQSIKDKQ